MAADQRGVERTSIFINIAAYLAELFNSSALSLFPPGSAPPTVQDSDLYSASEQ